MAFVGVRLLVRVVDPTLVPPEWLMVTLIAAVFAWGFSQRTEATAPSLAASDPETNLGQESASLPTVVDLEKACAEMATPITTVPEKADVGYAEPS